MAVADAPAGPSWPGVLRTKELKDKIKSAKVLCVGAGGIGCELLKTLVCTGFRNIEVIDLDTIETSNLNRQFLFRKHHVGHSKANTAAAVVQGFCPAASITAHHANVKEGRFDVDFFRGFDVVLNGLDNLEARRHVNRLCLAAERPLVESGTAGYLGQVTVHIKGRTACFECDPKPTPKTFPICTLRNTPDRPIHTVVWAKDLLFNRLFGCPETISDLDEQAAQQQPADVGKAAEDGGEADGDAAANAAANAAAAAAAAEDPSFFLRRDGEDSIDYAARIFERVYTTDIERLIGVKELWEKRPAPKALRLAEMLPEAELAAVRAALEAAKEGGGGGGRSACKALGLGNASQKWTPAENASVLLLSTALYHETRKEEVGSAAFDKDDDLAVEFVTSASNLRSSCYGIPEQSLFDAKGMAGNIIHAIATTNAAISGIIVTEALKLLAGCLSAIKNTFMYEFPVATNTLGTGIRRMVVVADTDPPKKSCMVCGKVQLTLRINTETTTLASLVSGVIKKGLAVNTPNLLAGGFLYEEGEGLEEDEVAAYSALLPRPLAALPGGGLRHGSILTVQDQSQGFGVDVIIVHTADLKEEDAPEGYVLEGAVPDAAAKQEAAAERKEAKEEEEAKDAAPAAGAKRKQDFNENADGSLELIDSDEEEAAKPAAQAPSKKRSLEADGGANGEEGADGGGGDGDEPGAKRAKGGTAATAAAAAAAGTGVTEDADGCICIDDDDD